MPKNNPYIASPRGGIDAAECMTILPRRSGESGSAYVYRLLEYNILMLYVQPGSIIRENSIAQRLDLSRTPVHEAVGLLRDRRLVDVAAQSATHVSCIDVSILRQCTFLRRALEPLVFSQLQGNMSEADLRLLADNVSEQRRTAASGNSAEVFNRFLDLDNEFHRIVFAAADKAYVWELVQKSSTPYERFRTIGLLYGYDVLDAHDHAEIYDVLASGGHSDEELTALISRHLNGYMSFYDELVADFPQYFVLHGPEGSKPAVPLPRR